MQNKKNLVYFGSPEFSSQILQSMVDTDCVNIVGVVTQPDKPLGRKQILTPSPVAQLTNKLDLPTYKPAQLNEANLAHIKLLKPDIFLVVSYGKIIPPSWLNTPSVGTFNIHFSLLPKYRGALCISEAIKNQDEVTGVTLMEMDELLDHGPIIFQEDVNIENIDDVSTLTTKLTQAAKQLLADKLPEICAQGYPTLGQDESEATYTPKTAFQTRDNAFIDPTVLSTAMAGQNAPEVSALIRSLTPEPGAWTKIDGQEIKILKTHLENDSLKLDTVQLAGKTPISWKQYASGHKK